MEIPLTVAAPECLGEITATPTLKFYLNGFILLSGKSSDRLIYTVYNRSNATNMQELALFSRMYS